MRLRRVLMILGLGALLFICCISQPANAAEAKKSDPKANTKTTEPITTGGASLQGFAADGPIQDGTIVQLKGSSASKVEVSRKADLGHMFGVTVDRNKLSVVTSTGAANEVFVANSGTYDTIVSSQGGDIKAGDYITLSAIDGVGMKADSEAAAVFGRAAADYNSKSDSIGKVSLKDTSGKEAKQVTLGVIPVAIDIKSNPIKKSTKTLVPDFLQRIGEAIAEKQVSPIRMYLSIAITGISIVAAIIILYSGVRNGLISIGRNPLSKKSIFRGLFEIILTSILILIIGLFAVYLLLKL